MVLRYFDRKGINLSSGMVPFLRPSAMNGINPASRTGVKLDCSADRKTKGS